MTELTFLAFALSVGAPLWHVGIVLLAWAAPLPALGLVGALAVRSLRSGAGGGAEGRLLLELAGSLRAGLSLRAALAAAGADQVGSAAVRLAMAGRPLDEVAGAIEPASVELIAAVGLAGRVGGSIAGALEALAAEELADAEARKEVKAAAAPMVLQALIVGGLPAGAVLYRLSTGSLFAELRGADIRAAMTALGVVAVAVGFAWILALVRRAVA